MEIHSLIAELWDGKPWNRDFDVIDGFAVHRVGVNKRTGQVIGTGALEIGQAFIGKRAEWHEVAAATGHQVPYTFMIGGDLGPAELDGRVWQCLPMDEIGAHARRWSSRHIGVALIGDPREHPVSAPQMASLVDLLADLCAAYAKDPYQSIKGHGEIQGGSKAPGQRGECPGKLLNMNHLRDDVATMMRERPRRRLTDSGLIWSFDR